MLLVAPCERRGMGHGASQPGLPGGGGGPGPGDFSERRGTMEPNKQAARAISRFGGGGSPDRPEACLLG